MTVIEYVEFAWVFGLVLICSAVIFANAIDRLLISTGFSRKYPLFIWAYVIGSLLLYGIAKIFDFVQYTLLVYYFVSGIIAGAIFGIVLRHIENKKRKS